MSLIKKYWLIIVLFLAALAVGIALSIWSGPPSAPGASTAPTATPTPAPTQQKYRGISPGASTRQDVISALGKPIREDPTRGGNALIYASGLGKRIVSVLVDSSGRVLFVKVPLESARGLAAETKRLGTPDATLYGDYYRFGFVLLVYLARGEAVLANPSSQEIREHWYFAPTTLSLFNDVFAPAFSQTPPELHD